MTTAEQNAIRIGLAVISDMETWGTSLRDAVRSAARALNVSEATVCHALTMAQDYIEDLRAA